MAWCSSKSDSAAYRIHNLRLVDGRSPAVYRKDEFRTPSPLLPAWHRGKPYDSAEMDEESNEDCYFRSCEGLGPTLQLPAVNGSGSDSSVIPLDLLDNYQLRCRNSEFLDSLGPGSQFRHTNGTLDKEARRASQMSSRQPPAAERRGIFQFLSFIYSGFLLAAQCPPRCEKQF